MRCITSKLFTLCTEEVIAFNAWKKTHAAECTMATPEPKPSREDPLGLGGLGAAATFGVFIRPGTIASGVEAVCDCGARHDITHMDHW